MKFGIELWEGGGTIFLAGQKGEGETCLACQKGWGQAIGEASDFWHRYFLGSVSTLRPKKV